MFEITDQVSADTTNISIPVHGWCVGEHLVVTIKVLTALDIA